MPTVPMMLSPSYAPTWTPFEALREIVANAMDADPSYTIEFPTASSCLIRTSTVPRLAHLLMMGSGTKTAQSGTIGQFGEGAKLAALVLTRTEGCSLTIDCQDICISFTIDTIDGLDESSLHAHIDRLPSSDEPPLTGCVIRIEAPSLFNIYDARFLPRARALTYGPVSDAADSASFRVFHRGIHVTTLPEHALFDWNLQTLEMNRDRSMPDLYALRSHIGTLLTKSADPILDQLLADQSCYEWKCLRAAWLPDAFKSRLLSRFIAAFGDTCCLRSSSSEPSNRAATGRGYRLLTLPDDMRNTLSSAGLKSADEIATVSDLLTEVPIPNQTAALARIEKCLDLLDCPCTVRIFNADDAPLTLGRFESPSIIWLSSALFAPGSRLRLLSTLFHEAAHFHSHGAADLSQEFEEGLSTLGGTLLQSLLR